MKTADWRSITDAKILLIGENSTLQWNDEVITHAMFLDYYFDHAPYDLGERSRYSEAKAIFEYIGDITNNRYSASSLYGTLLTNESLVRPPKGKHLYIPEDDAKRGVQKIKKILKENLSIEYIFAIGMQTNYYLQKEGFYNAGALTEPFLKGAEPRRVGASAYEPFYQPVNARPFREICFKEYEIEMLKGVKIIPILPIKNIPLKESDLAHFGDNFNALKQSFRDKESK